jgi:hypothetical protein
MVDMIADGNRVKLENYQIKKSLFLAEYEVITTEETQPIFDTNGMPMFDEKGNPIIVSKFTKVSRVSLKPEIKEAKIKEEKNNAIQKRSTKKVDVEKQAKDGERVGS